MKLRLPLPLKSALLALATYVPTLYAQQDSAGKASIGDWMLIGDSISHGTFNCTYRWNIQQIFIDNGIGFNAVGPLSGGYYAGYDTATYGGKQFQNNHAAQYNIYGKEISGQEVAMDYDDDYGLEEMDPPYRIDKDGRDTSMLHSNVKNWLGLEEELTLNTLVGKDEYANVPLIINGQECTTYEQAWKADGRPAAEKYQPQTVTIMMGTNDRKNGMLGDPQNPDGTLVRNQEILENVKIVVDSVLERNRAADVYLMSMPCTNQINGGGIGRLPTSVSERYNQDLAQWVEEYNREKGTNVHYVNVNAGMLDVSVDISTYSVGGVSAAATGMMADWTHMSTQGNLIVAGNLAKGMGYAGRTAGQGRKGAAEFAQNTYCGGFNTGDLDSGNFVSDNVSITGSSLDFGSQGLSQAFFEWDNQANLSTGYTVDFNMVLGDGATGGWNKQDNFSISISDGINSGLLNISECYIKWGDSILYSRDASESISDNLRVAYVVGDREDDNNLAAGYYVWLGDQLIGEACLPTWGETVQDANGVTVQAGVTLTYAGEGNALLNSISMDSTASWAPTYDTDTLYAGTGYTAGTAASSCHNRPQGADLFSDAYKPGIYTHDDVTKRLLSSHRRFENAEGRQMLYANYDGDVAKYAELYYKYTPEGLAELDEQTQYETEYYQSVAFPNGKVPWSNYSWQFGDGDRTMDFAGFGKGSLANQDIKVRFYDENPGFQTVYGVYGDSPTDSLQGSMLIQLDAQYALYESYKGASNMNVGGTLKLVMNTGTLHGNIVGGFAAATESNTIGATEIFINYDSLVEGNVYGGSECVEGTITGNTSVTVTGGRIKGSVYGGGVEGSSIGGTSSVTITGGEIDGDVYGGSAGDGQKAGSVTVEGNLARIHGDITAKEVVLKDVANGEDAEGFDKYEKTITATSLTLDHFTADEFNAKVDVDNLTAENQTNTRLTAADSRIGTVVLKDSSRVDMTLGSTKLSVTDLTLNTKAASAFNVSSGGLATVSVEGTLMALSGATFAGNVEMMTGSTLDIRSSAGLDVSGSVTLHTGIMLGSDMLDTLEGLEDGSYVTLFTGATQLLLSGRSGVLPKTLAAASADTLSLVTDADAATYFVNLEKGQYTVAYSLNGDNVGMITLQKGTANTPEPATGSLSLLALAALCARRRRK